MAISQTLLTVTLLSLSLSSKLNQSQIMNCIFCLVLHCGRFGSSYYNSRKRKTSHYLYRVLLLCAVFLWVQIIQCLGFLMCTQMLMHVIDWLMIAYIALFSALLSRLIALACGSAWVTSFVARFCFVFEYPPKWCTYSAGMAGATSNCSRLGASPVYTIQPCSMSLYAKPHT